MKKLISVVSVICFLLAVGCARPPSPEEMASWNYGPYPENYEEVVKAAMVRYLIDPYSAQYHFQGRPTQGWVSKPFGGGTEHGWGGMVLINAKNRMGGYVGAKEFVYIIRDGQLKVFEESLYMRWADR